MKKSSLDFRASIKGTEGAPESCTGRPTHTLGHALAGATAHGVDAVTTQIIDEPFVTIKM